MKNKLRQALLENRPTLGGDLWAAGRRVVGQRGPGFGKRTMDTPFWKRSW